VEEVGASLDKKHNTHRPSYENVVTGVKGSALHSRRVDLGIRCAVDEDGVATLPGNAYVCHWRRPRRQNVIALVNDDEEEEEIRTFEDWRPMIEAEAPMHVGTLPCTFMNNTLEIVLHWPAYYPHVDRLGDTVARITTHPYNVPLLHDIDEDDVKRSVRNAVVLTLPTLEEEKEKSISEDDESDDDDENNHMIVNMKNEKGVKVGVILPELLPGQDADAVVAFALRRHQVPLKHLKKVKELLCAFNDRRRLFKEEENEAQEKLAKEEQQQQQQQALAAQEAAAADAAKQEAHDAEVASMVKEVEAKREADEKGAAEAEAKIAAEQKKADAIAAAEAAKAAEAARVAEAKATADLALLAEEERARARVAAEQAAKTSVADALVAEEQEDVGKAMLEAYGKIVTDDEVAAMSDKERKKLYGKKKKFDKALKKHRDKRYKNYEKEKKKKAKEKAKRAKEEAKRANKK
jgi:hypothetical protein